MKMITLVSQYVALEVTKPITQEHEAIQI